MSRPMWYIKQLFPLRYISEYRENGQRKLTIWRMWLGRCYDISTYTLTDCGTQTMGRSSGGTQTAGLSECVEVDAGLEMIHKNYGGMMKKLAGM